MRDGPTAIVPSTIPQTRSCSYTFEKDILIVEDVIDWGAKLIETAEEVGKVVGWNRATIASHVSAGPAGPGGIVPERDVEYESENRNNDSIVVRVEVHPKFRDLEFWLSQAIHSCVRAYKALNKHLMARKDTYVSVLRYGPGEHFHEHTDTIVGHTSWGARVLSAVAFLNDDFDGGELVFPRQNVTVKKAGTVVLFPSGFTHPHASRDVVRGTKYSAVTWLI